MTFFSTVLSALRKTCGLLLALALTILVIVVVYVSDLPVCADLLILPLLCVALHLDGLLWPQFEKDVIAFGEYFRHQCPTAILLEKFGGLTFMEATDKVLVSETRSWLELLSTASLAFAIRVFTRAAIAFCIGFMLYLVVANWPLLSAMATQPGTMTPLYREPVFCTLAATLLPTTLILGLNWRYSHARYPTLAELCEEFLSQKKKFVSEFFSPTFLRRLLLMLIDAYCAARERKKTDKKP